jgi:hypothetical protein
MRPVRLFPPIVLLAIGCSGGSAGSPGAGGKDGGSGASDGATAPGQSFPTTGPVVAGTVTIDPATTVGQVGPRFVGLSYEKSHLTDGFFSAANAPLVALFKLLGPSLLRIGGNSVDATTWDPSSLPADAGAIGTTIGAADVDDLRAFLDATGWTAIYAVGLKSSTPAAAAAEATYAASTLGGTLYGFEIGNEIDLYGLSYTQLLASWNGEESAIHAAVPAAKMTGPAMADYNSIAQFASDEAQTISLLTQHYYIGDGLVATSTMATMLAPDPNLPPLLQTMQSVTKLNAIADGYRIDETNSFYDHGAPYVSNAFGSALWAIDYLFANATSGSSGVNFHGGGAGQDGPTPFLYTPIEEIGGVVTGAQPIFYGMLLFTLAGTGDVLAATATAANVDFRAYAVSHADGSSALVLANRDATKNVAARVDLGKAATSARAIYLQAPTLSALTGTTLGGAPISAAGEWSATSSWALAVSGQTVTVTVPPASAVLVQVGAPPP